VNELLALIRAELRVHQEPWGLESGSQPLGSIGRGRSPAVWLGSLALLLVRRRLYLPPDLSKASCSICRKRSNPSPLSPLT
jgi:hypothetical protein